MKIYIFLVAAFISILSCTNKSKKSTDDHANADTTSSVSSPTNGAVKLTLSDCIDPNLDKLSASEQIMLCDGSIVSGNQIDHGAVNAQNTFPTSGQFSGWENLPVSTDFCDSVNFNGAQGSAICGSFISSFASTMHHDVGAGTPVQISLEAAKGNASLPAAYREFPEIIKDDFGLPNIAVANEVTRNGANWDGVAPRKVCGMGIASVAGRISDCDGQHVVKPDWDVAPTDGRIGWDGSVHGTASEGHWTLVTVYKSGSTNGTVCAASDCYEVWRDDRTELVWSDVLGILNSDVVNQDKWNWCVASGNTEAAGGGNVVECQPTTPGSYNYMNISLCAEDGVRVTPDSVWSETNNTDLTTMTLSGGNEILSAKGGMKLNADQDPSGSSPIVRWRLPSYAGLALAMIVNGGYLVLPHAGDTAAPTGEWTASMYAPDFNNAWLYYPNGSTGFPSRAITHTVRCVGRQ